jgi:hypothetical protein
MVEGGWNVLGDVDADRARADVVGVRYMPAALGGRHARHLVVALFSVRYDGPQLT